MSRKIKSTMILITASILFSLIMILIEHEIDYISWWGGVIFAYLGYLLGEWCANE